jgi:uncharacterized protein
VTTIVMATGALVVGSVVVLDRIAARLVRPIVRPSDRDVPETGIAHESLSIPSGDRRLGAWLLCPDGLAERPLLLLAHGWGASYGTLLMLAEPLVAAGFEVLIFDIRGHGRNEPAPYVTVRHFKDDIAAVAGYAKERYPDRPIVVVGHSLGGAAGVLAVADGAPLDGLVLVAAPADVVRITEEYLSDRGVPGKLLVRLIRPFWWLRLGSTFRPLTPTRRIREVTIPLLILQPENDQRVVRDHADRLAAASGKGYELIPDCEHTDVLGHPETTRLVADFARGLGVDR